MNDTKLLAYIAKEIDRMRQENAAFLISGRADSHAEYRHVCGIIRGLNLTGDFINDLVQRMENADE